MLRDHITNPRGNNITPGRVHSLASAAASHLMPLHIPRLYHIYTYTSENIFISDNKNALLLFGIKSYFGN